MITFLITPAKSKRDSLLADTPACRLTFEMAETPALFDCLSVHQLKKLHTLNDSNLLQTVKTSKSSRESLCNLSICGDLLPFNKRSSIYGELPSYSSSNNKRASICSNNSVIAHPRLATAAAAAPAPPQSSPSPVVRLFDTSVLECEVDVDTLTPANVFNNTLHKIHDELLLFGDDNGDVKEGEYEFGTEVTVVNDEHNDVVTSTQINDEFCITMLITRERPSQQTIEQYLNLNTQFCARSLHICQSCECLPCKHRNWNVLDIRDWEKQWQTQQFTFNIVDIDTPQQIVDVRCDHISHILHSNGVLQSELLEDARHTLWRKLFQKRRAPPSAHCSHDKKQKKRLPGVAADDGDKAIMLRHLQSSSSSTSQLSLPANKHDDDGDECKLFEYTAQTIDYLPLVDKQDNGCSYISGDTLMQLLLSSATAAFDYFVIVDCRYSYEYLAGHIRGAINVSDPLLIELLFQANITRVDHIESQRIAWIFHCEYSKHRGPQTCKYFRKLDREMNAHRYPFVSYPHVYVLQGGYKAFWYRYKDCYRTLKQRIFEPFGFVSMWSEIFDDKRFVYSRFRQNAWKKGKHKQKKKEVKEKEGASDRVW